MSGDSGRHLDQFEPFVATPEEERAYAHGCADGRAAARHETPEEAP